MIDLKELKEKRTIIGKNIKHRNMNIDLDEIIRLQHQRSELLQETEHLRKQRNENAAMMKSKLDADRRVLLIAEGKALKEAIAVKEAALNEIEITYLSMAKSIPNYTHPEVPVGKLDADNLQIKTWGNPTAFDFIPKDHVELGQSLDLIDFDTATRVSGAKFYYLKNEAVLLELALERYALDILRSHGFTLTITPDIAKEEILEGIGFNPRGEESNIYTIEGTGTCLVGTAEITLGGYHADSILDKEQLPIKMAGLSHCFRREAGSAGQFSKGLYRVHQFSKVEMFVYCLPGQSDIIHKELLEIEEEIFQGLEIPYRVVDTCTGDLGAPAYRKFDIEAWMPGRGDQGEYGEVTSTSNCTDYQARSLNIRYREDDGKSQFVHLLNGTAVAVSRAIVAILENFQQQDGSVRMPKKLVPYLGFDRIIR
ncbi:MAG: serine--tRNA ligase [Sphaerochaetaceae bacterium]|jgi:seryl-tRNA synthetase|nr:serine--tRNA ligase [Sphaerochaetaceae bacterium]MDD3671465.1 serine--tRNA ligase [Sphaerochaetaceae bacterium]MDX9935307.1 serine--tRNA ligase [Sphaerochaetaceae bacterium]